VNRKRRSPASAGRQAEASLLTHMQEDALRRINDPPPMSMIDSKTTRATPCPADPPETEETLP